MSIARWQMIPIEPAEIASLDLQDELTRLEAAGEPLEVYQLVFWDEHERQHTERAELLFVPEAGRGGIAWGAPADWTDAETAEEAVERYAKGEMIE